MADGLQQLGLLGLFVLLLYREVIRPLVNQRVSNKATAQANIDSRSIPLMDRAGDHSPEYWILKTREIADQAALRATETVVAILDRQTVILAEMARNQQEMIVIFRAQHKN